MDTARLVLGLAILLLAAFHGALNLWLSIHQWGEVHVRHSSGRERLRRGWAGPAQGGRRAPAGGRRGHSDARPEQSLSMEGPLGAGARAVTDNLARRGWHFRLSIGSRSARGR